MTPRMLPVYLDETVTDTHCGGCGYRHVTYAEIEVCSQDMTITSITCGLILGERVVNESGEVFYRSIGLRDDFGLSAQGFNLYNNMTGDYDPLPETVRLPECIERENQGRALTDVAVWRPIRYAPRTGDRILGRIVNGGIPYVTPIAWVSWRQVFVDDLGNVAQASHYTQLLPAKINSKGSHEPG